MKDVIKMVHEFALLSPAGARTVTTTICRCGSYSGCCPPQGRELLREISGHQSESHWLLSPAGARAVTFVTVLWAAFNSLLSPAGARVVTGRNFHAIDELFVAVPRRGASCYGYFRDAASKDDHCCPPQGRELLHAAYSLYDARNRWLLSPAGARAVTSPSMSTVMPISALLSPAGARAVTEHGHASY